MDEVEDLWPAHLDALVAAPEHHTLLLENDNVRVLETLIRPGEVTNLHTHRWPAVTYFIEWSDALRRDAAGSVTMDTRNQERKIEPGEATWSPPLPPHTLENLGPGTIRVVTVELKGNL